MELSLAQIEHATNARLQGAGSDADSLAIARQTTISGWSIDSRTVASGDLFIALRGERFDGHEYIRPALERGAWAALVERIPEPLTGPVLAVKDTLKALQSLARTAREQWQKPIVAVTGSAGKTSTKDIIAALLGMRLRVGKTVGNFNNHIGLPLSLLRLPESAEAGVLEMGMNHAGEIRELARIARPQIAVVTNVGYAHIEAFESMAGGSTRTVPAREFFVDLFESAVGEGELLTQVRIPKHTGWGAHYEKFVRVKHQWSIVAVAATVRVDSGTIAEARIGLTNMGSTPLRATSVESALVGKEATEDAVREAAASAADGTNPPSDLNGDSDYRKHLATVLTRRAVLAAAGA